MSHMVVETQSPVQGVTAPPLLILVFQSWKAVSFASKISVRVCQKDALRESVGARVVFVKAETSSP